MIPLDCRHKGSGPQLGARHEGETGPFGTYGADEDADGQDDEPVSAIADTDH